MWLQTYLDHTLITFCTNFVHSAAKKSAESLHLPSVVLARAYVNPHRRASWKVRYWATGVSMSISLSLLPPGIMLCSTVCCTRRSTMIRVQLHRQRQQEAEWCEHKWCCAYTISISRPLVITASRNHPLLNSVTALVLWLISSSLDLTPVLPSWSCMHAL